MVEDKALTTATLILAVLSVDDFDCLLTGENSHSCEGETKFIAADTVCTCE